MTDLRSSLLGLPFVTQKSDGTLNLWDVNPTGCEQTDTENGRFYFARFLHFMRTCDAAHMLLHVSEAWAADTDPRCSRAIKSGWTHEMTESIRAARDPHPSLATVSHREFSSDLRVAALSLPFVTERADGSLFCFDANYSGKYEEAQARGRHYAALTAHFLRKTEHPSFLTWLALAVDPAQQVSSLRIGFLTALAEIAICSPRSCTPYATAMWPHFAVTHPQAVPEVG